MMVAERNWLIEPRSGAAHSQSELLVGLGAADEYCPLCQPRSTAEALHAVALAIACERDIILFDTDFSADEIHALGFTPEQLTERVTLPARTPFTFDSLARLAAGGSSARIGLFTSGSTGLPKLVWQSVANLARGVRTGGRHAESVWALAYNPTHIAGVQVFLQGLANGCPLVDVFGLDRSSVLNAVERYGITHLSATPSFYRLLLPVERPLGGVRSVTLGGESSDASLVERLRPLFPAARFHNIYASTEAGTLLVAKDDAFTIAPGLEGRVQISDGRLRVHRSLLGEFDGCGADEWYDTGDIVELVDESPLRFRIVARQRDWINVGGSKVNPRDVERVAEEHPSVTFARVFSRSNSVVGRLLCAEVVLRPGATVTEPQLREFLGARLQSFKVPRIIRFVAELAVTRSGKLSRL
jgi:acyl-CoA synthetase (AMP-forming)/AMP-acid ligase II